MNKHTNQWFLMLMLCITTTLGSLSAWSYYQKRHPDCVTDDFGVRVCAKEIYGTITQDELGNIVCAKGECASDELGNLICSNQSGGKVRYNSIGNVACKGECVSPSASECRVLGDDEVE